MLSAVTRSTKSRRTQGPLGLGPQAVPQTNGININCPLGLGPADLYHPLSPGRGDSHAPEPLSLLGENPALEPECHLTVIPDSAVRSMETGRLLSLAASARSC